VRWPSGDGRPATPPTVKPELLATRPNQVWSWDITKLGGPAKWTWFYLYTIIDISSRYVPGWLLARAERAPWPSGCWPTPSPTSTSTAAS
jgi:transposase InsO family protein